MNTTRRRALLYGGAALLLGGLGVVAATHHADADVLTLLSSADVQLRLAHGIPTTDKAGKELSARGDMIALAEEHLATVERLQPGMAVTAEFQGFAAMLRGRYEQAAVSYARARACGDCQPEQHDVLAFNEARMWAKAGRGEQALAVFGRYGAMLDRRFGPQRALEESDILRQLGRRDQAEQRLDAVMVAGAVAPLASLQAGVGYLELGCRDKADQALQRAAVEVPIADYHRARLKLQTGDVDSALALLGRAADARPAEVRQRLRDEAEAWSGVAADARFQELLTPRAATPSR